MRPATVVSRHGYSMTDLLCVMCVAGIVVSVGLPLISAARKQTRADLSRARLVELSKLQLRYANDNGGTFYFPWQRSSSSESQYRFLINVGGSNGTTWGVVPSGFGGESMGMSWYSHMQGEMSDIAAKTSLVQFAPDDSVRVSQMRSVLASGNDANLALWGGSYQLSPTVWFKPAMYAGATDRANLNSLNLRPNRIDDIVNPSAKVLLSERLGFYNAAGSPIGVLSQPRTWAHPSARVNASLMDGSVLAIDMQAVESLATSSNPAINSVFMPSGGWKAYSIQDLTDDMLPSVNPYPAGLTDFRAFFWATRNGVAGRDIDRERVRRFTPQNISPAGQITPIQ